MTPSVAVTAALTAGPPENVEPWFPASSAIQSAHRVAPTGSPFARPFAVVSTSGVTPAASLAHREPVRPRPVWISSTTIAAPASAVASRTASR